MEKKNIMDVEAVLPENFNGTFYFTNWTGEEFVGKWGGKEYRFPAESTSPMIIHEHSPIEIQQIRKKFAKNLAEREYFKSKDYKVFQKQEGTPGNRTMSGIHQAGTYSLDDLTSYIQKCLKPLEIKQATVSQAEKRDIEGTLSKDSDGITVTQPIKGQGDLEKMMRN